MPKPWDARRGSFLSSQSGTGTSSSATTLESQKFTSEEQYDEAKRLLLGDIVPAEETNSCFGKFNTSTHTNIILPLDSIKCILFYSLCCCICYSNKGTPQSTKASFMHRFTKWIKLDKKDVNEDSKMGVVKALMRLYAHQSDAIKDLKELCRVNPDFTS